MRGPVACRRQTTAAPSLKQTAALQRKRTSRIAGRLAPGLSSTPCMQLYEHSVALRIWHPNVDPALISAKLSLEPQHSHMAGRPRQAPDGRLLGGNHLETYWYCEPLGRRSYVSTDDAAEDVLASVVSALRPHKTFLLLLREQAGRLHLQVSSFSSRNYALELSPELLMQSAVLGLSIVHDVYPTAQTW